LGLVGAVGGGQAGEGMAAVTTVNDLLAGHVSLDIECMDRIYLNGYVPNLEVGGQAAWRGNDQCTQRRYSPRRHPRRPDPRRTRPPRAVEAPWLLHSAWTGSDLVVVPHADHTTADLAEQTVLATGRFATRSQ
jgi:hypothetical protein